MKTYLHEPKFCNMSQNFENGVQFLENEPILPKMNAFWPE